MFRARLAVLVLVSAGILSACSSPSSSSSGREIPGNKDPLKKSDAYVKNSCFGTYNEGEVATVHPVRVGETFFHKKLDLGKLDSLSFASPKETYAFALASGVDVYQTPDDVGGCRLFKDVPAAPSALLELWNAANKGGGLLGLFNPINRVSSLGFSRAVIMVRGDTSRYTLVHEFMHHLFNSERENHGYNDGVVIRRFDTALDTLEASIKVFGKGDLTADKLRKDPAAARVFMKAWVEMAEARLPIEENFSLEEVTIESTLLQRNVDGQFGPISDFDKKISRAYIADRAQAALGTFQTLREVANAMGPLAMEMGFDDIAASASSLNTIYGDHTEEVSDLRRKYVGSTTESMLASGIAAKDVAAALKGKSGCAHEQRVRNMLKRADRLTAKLK